MSAQGSGHDEPGRWKAVHPSGDLPVEVTRRGGSAIEPVGGAFRVVVSVDDLVRAHERFPAEDFVQETYDTVGAPLREVLLVLSTPRSGSTYFCDVLRREYGPVAHEYFHLTEYLPFLAERWGVIGPGGAVDGARYVAELIARRTDENGRLAINLHGGHLALFDAWIGYFPDVPVRLARIVRADTAAQAVSYEIASQTGQWSAHFARLAEPEYSFDAIWAKVRELVMQEATIDAYLESSGFEVMRIDYDGFVQQPEHTMAEFVGSPAPAHDEAPKLISRQGNAINETWRTRFLQDFDEAQRAGRLLV